MQTTSHRPAATRAFLPPPVLTPQAFHKAIQGTIGLNTIYELLRAGRLRHARIGNRYLVLASETHDFFEREAQASAEGSPWI